MTGKKALTFRRCFPLRNIVGGVDSFEATFEAIGIRRPGDFNFSIARPSNRRSVIVIMSLINNL